MSKKPLPQFRKPWKTADGKTKQGFWQVRLDGRYVPLLNQDGEKINSPKARDEAVVALAALLSKQAADEVEATDPTLQTLVDRYLTDFTTKVARGERSQGSLEKATEYAFDFLTGCRLSVKGQGPRVHKGYGGLRVSQLRKADMADWIAAHPNWRCPKRPFNVVNAALNLCLSLDLIPHNPIAGYKLPQSKYRDEVWEMSEVDMVRRHAKKAFRKLFDAMLATGARPGELARVKACHLHREGGHAFWLLTEHKTARKTGDKRYIHLTPELEAMTLAAIAKGDTGYLFVSSRGSKWTRNVWGPCIRRLRAKLKKLYPSFRTSIRFYDLRATYITLGLEAGTDITLLAKSAGTSVEMIERTYGRWTKDTARLIGEAAIKARSKQGFRIAAVG